GLVHGLPDSFDRLESVRAGLEIDEDERRRFAVDATEEVVAPRAELDASDVLEAHDRAVLVRAKDDALVLLGLAEPTPRQDGHGELGERLARRALADHARGEDGILLADRGGDVGDGHAARGEAVRIDPDPHRVLLRPEDGRVADAGHAPDAVEEIDRRVVAE